MEQNTFKAGDLVRVRRRGLCKVISVGNDLGGRYVEVQSPMMPDTTIIVRPIDVRYLKTGYSKRCAGCGGYHFGSCS